MKVKIYAGLSATRQQVLGILPKATFADPIRRRDLQRDIAEGFHVVGIVDGLFDQNLAVSATEVLDALRVGIRVFGSSSMGALRAVELSAYGMIGVGKIFDRISTSVAFEDDKLGQTFFDSDRRHLTLAAIDLEFGLEKLVRERKISPSTSNSVFKAYNRLHFSERNLARVIYEVSKGRLFDSRQTKAVSHLKQIQSTKGADARLLLRTIRAFSQECLVSRRWR